MRSELQRYAFPAPERMLLKIKAQMVGPYEQLLARVLPSGGAPSSAENGHPMQQQQPNFLPAFQLWWKNELKTIFIILIFENEAVEKLIRLIVITMQIEFQKIFLSNS